MKYCSECEHCYYQGRGAYLCTITEKIVIVSDVPSEFHLACKYEKRLVAQLSNDGNIIGVFKNAAEAARETQIHSSGIYHCLYGHQKKAGGYGWKYTTEGRIKNGNNERDG